METIVSKSKFWISKTFQYLWDIILCTYHATDCFRNCRQTFIESRQFRTHQRQNDSQPCEVEIKIALGDSPVPSMDDFLRKPKIGNRISNSTEETASDDSLLGSPDVEQRREFNELTLRKSNQTYDTIWTIDENHARFQEDQRRNEIIQSNNHTQTDPSVCSSCATIDTVTNGSDCCYQLKKINEELLIQIQNSNDQITILQYELSEIRRRVQLDTRVPLDNDTGSVTIIDEIDQKSLCASNISKTILSNNDNINCQLFAVPSTSTVTIPTPPPPPPLPRSWTNIACGNSKKKKSVPVASSALKTLNWIKLSEDSLGGSVWHKIDDEQLYGLLDLKEIEKHFSCTAYPDAFNTIRSRLSVCSIMREVSVLDARRAQNCAILLSKLKLSDKEICDAVRILDSNDMIPKDMAEQLLKFIPTPEEIALLSQTNCKEALHPADRFFMEIASVKRYEQRLRCLCFKKLCIDTMDDLTKKISCVTTASKRLLISKRLPKLLGAILAIGNYLNQSKRCGDASGFHLSTLTSLHDVKSSQNCEYTLMHYLVEIFQKSMPDIFEISQEIITCIDAAKISGSDIQFDMTKLKDGLKLFTNEIQAGNDSEHERDVFLSIAKTLLSDYEKNYIILENNFKHMMNEFTSCCKAYAPEEHYQDTLNVSELFGYFAQFLNQFTIVETQVERKRRDQEIRTLTRTKPKRPSLVSVGVPVNCNQKIRKSGRVNKKSISDVNDDLLTSVLLAMDKKRGEHDANELILCGRKQRRSFRLSTKRKQIKTQNNNQQVIRRRTTTRGQMPDTNNKNQDIISDNDSMSINCSNRCNKNAYFDDVCRERQSYM